MQVRNRNIRACIWLRIVVLVALSMTGCAGPYYSHSFKTDVKNAKAIDVFVLAPTEVPSELPQADQAKLVFDTAISEKLTQAGFQLVGQEVFAEKMAAVTREKGGAYDATTGKRDEKKFQELQKASLKQIQTTTGAKALLRAKVTSVPARFSGCKASWDGTTQDVSTTFLGIFCSSAQAHGKVTALSLIVTLEDIDGNVLYFNGGGIQLLAKISFGLDFQDVPKEELLTDKTRNRAAVDQALGPLLAEGSSRP
jgi:hypothetical protein